MEKIIENAVAFFLIIFFGYMSRKKGILTMLDGRNLGKVIMNITLPCALLSTVRSMEIGLPMLLAILLAIIVQFIMLYVGYAISKGSSSNERAAYALNVSGFNIGNFAVPFAQYFYEGNAISYISMFDIGNSFMGLGINYCVGTIIAYRDCHQRISDILKKLFSSVPFDTYLLLFVFSLLHFELPECIINITSRIGSSNTFLSMFMVGLLLDFHISKDEYKSVIKILGARLIGSFIFVLIVWFLFPVPVVAKQMLMIALLSPSMSVAPLFCYYVGYKGNMPAIIGSCSMLISIVNISILLVLFQ